MKYKLTDQNGYTRTGFTNALKWGEGVTHTAQYEGNTLCTRQVIHFYDSPYVAMFMNPIHANIKNPLCWEGEGMAVAHDGTKGGCKTFTTVKTVQIPDMTIKQRVEIAIRLVLTVYHDKSYKKWADDWLSGKDRSYEAAWAAAGEKEAAGAATWAAWAAARATRAAARAAWAATWAAWAAARAAAGEEEAAAGAAWAAEVLQNNNNNSGVFSEVLQSIIKDVLNRRQEGL